MTQNLDHNEVVNLAASQAAANRPPRGPAWLRVALTPVVMLASLLLAAVSLAPLAAFPNLAARLNEPGNVVGPFAVVAQNLLVLALVVLGTWLLVSRLDRRTLRGTGWTWTRYSLPLLVLGLAMSAAVVLVAQLVAPSSGRTVDVLREPVWATVIIMITQAVLLQGIPEELLFRGYLMQTLRRRPLVALTTSTLLFGIIHLASSGGQQGWGERLVYLTTPTAFGFAAATLLLLTRSLWPAVGIHIGFHVATLLAAMLGMASTGPAVWVLTAVGYAATGAAALALWLHRKGHRTEIRLDR